MRKKFKKKKSTCREKHEKREEIYIIYNIYITKFFLMFENEIIFMNKIFGMSNDNKRIIKKTLKKNIT